jgi:very-short-patch-repair endonuclease
MKYSKAQLVKMADKLLSIKKRKKPRKKKKGKTYQFVIGCANEMRKKPTSLEIRHVNVLHTVLKDIGARATVLPQHVEKIVYKFIIIDVVILIEGKKIAWEIDGPHHDFRKAKDKLRDAALKNIGYQTIRTSYFHTDEQITKLLLSVLPK